MVNNFQVGAKSRNISYLKRKVPSWIGIPTSVAIPFGVFEKVLSDRINQVSLSSELEYKLPLLHVYLFIFHQFRLLNFKNIVLKSENLPTFSYLQAVAKKLQSLKRRLGGGDFSALKEIRTTILELQAPKQLVCCLAI